MLPVGETNFEFVFVLSIEVFLLYLPMPAAFFPFFFLCV